MTKPTIKNHIRYYQGEIPLILSAPHGGQFSPNDITDRSGGVFDMDDFTLELTEDIIQEFYLQIGKSRFESSKRESLRRRTRKNSL